MKTATKKMILKALAPYIEFDGIFPYIKFMHIPAITAELLTNFSNVYCEVSGEDTECPVLIVKSTTKHAVFVKIIIERKF